MVGGETSIVERLRPVFDCWANKIIHAGPTGCGIALKLCNNLMTYAAFAAIDEGVRLAKAGGLDPTLLIDVGRANGVVTPQMAAFFGNRSAERRVGKASVSTFRSGWGPFHKKQTTKTKNN